MTEGAGTEHAVVLFDGVCNLCNSSVNFIIRRDKRDYFRFAPLQSAKGAEIQERYNLESSEPESLILIEDGRAYLKSAGALRIARRLGGPYPLLYAFIIVPPIIRDSLYDWVARNRYKWFGRKDSCMVPSPEVKSKFLAD